MNAALRTAWIVGSILLFGAALIFAAGVTINDAWRRAADEPLVIVTPTAEPEPAFTDVPPACRVAARELALILIETNRDILDPMVNDMLLGRVPDPDWYASTAAPLGDRQMIVETSTLRECLNGEQLR